MRSASSRRRSGGFTTRLAGEPDAHFHAVMMLRDRGINARRVVRILSPGDSGTGYETILYTLENGRCGTAVVVPDPERRRVLIQTRAGFDL